MAGAVGLTLFRRDRPSLSTLDVDGGDPVRGHRSCWPWSATSRTAAAVLAVLGCCQILFTTGCNTTLQLATPDALRGRVMGLYALAFAGMTPFGALLIGFVAEHLGVRVACAAQRRPAAWPRWPRCSCPIVSWQNRR